MANLPEKEKLVRNFNRCANWEEKYLYIIELGDKLPESSESLYQPENAISGCQSQVWITMHPSLTTPSPFRATVMRRSLRG